MNRLHASLAIVLLLFGAALSFGQDVAAPEETEQPAQDEAGEEVQPVPGFIFNTPNLLMDISAYQGGFGGKLRFPNYAIRGLISAAYQSTNSQLETGIGIAYERPFFPGRVTPFWGLVADVVFSGERVELDAENYTQTRVLAGAAGFVLGIEVLIFDFLSVFGEYQLSLDVSRTSVEQAVAATVTEDSSTNFFAGAGLGNEGAIGLVIYLRPLGILESEDEAAVE